MVLLRSLILAFNFTYVAFSSARSFCNDTALACSELALACSARNFFLDTIQDVRKKDAKQIQAMDVRIFFMFSVLGNYSTKVITFSDAQNQLPISLG